MRNILLVFLPTMLIFSLITSSFTYVLMRSDDYKSTTERPILSTPSHIEKELVGLRKLTAIEKTKEFASDMISKCYKESSSINSLLISQLKVSSNDFFLLAWVFVLLFVLISILTIGIYPLIKTSTNKSLHQTGANNSPPG